VRQDAVVGVLGGILRHADAEGAALLHAFEDEVDAIGILLLHAAQRGPDAILFADAFFRPLHRELVVAGVSFHPAAVIVGALAEDFLAHHRDAEHLAKEVDHLLRPGQAAEVAVDDNAVEAVIYENDQAAKQLGEPLHRSSPFALVGITRSSDRRPLVSKFQISLASFNVTDLSGNDVAFLNKRNKAFGVRTPIT